LLSTRNTNPPGCSPTDRYAGPSPTGITAFFLDDGQRKTVLRDEVDYLPPLGKLGDLLGGWFVESKLRRRFDHRHQVNKRIVESGEFPKVSQVP